MEDERNWPIDKIDKELESSQAAFVFGQMNEPPGARLELHFRD